MMTDNLKKLANCLKAEGAKVLVRKELGDNGVNYFFFSFGDNIVFYMEYTRFGEVTMSVEYRSKGYGSGCRVMDESECSFKILPTIKQIHSDIKKYGVHYHNRNVPNDKVTLYDSIEAYYSRYWERDKWEFMTEYYGEE